jgi:hypothetical protein
VGVNEFTLILFGISTTIRVNQSGKRLAYRHALGLRIATSPLIRIGKLHSTDPSELGLKRLGLPNQSLFVDGFPGKEGKINYEVALQDQSTQSSAIYT